jgi:hypothetical protein
VYLSLKSSKMVKYMKHTSRRTLIPEDFEVSQEIMEMVAARNWPDPREQLQKFKDFHLAHGTLMFDWEAAFRTWLNNAVGFGAKPMPKVQAKDLKRQRELPLTDEERAAKQKMVHEFINSIGKKI